MDNIVPSHSGSCPVAVSASICISIPAPLRIHRRAALTLRAFGRTRDAMAVANRDRIRPRRHPAL